MKVSLRQIKGPWDVGWVLDKHSSGSQFLGYDAYGHPQFDTTRTDVGEATYRLKYKGDSGKIEPLAQAIATNIYPMLKNVGFIVPMPASKARARQPVTAVAEELGAIVKVHVATDLLLKAPGGKSLKDLGSKDEKIEAIGNSFSVVDRLSGTGPWNVLLVDDLYHTGASMDAACKVLREYAKVAKIYVAALTWR